MQKIVGILIALFLLTAPVSAKDYYIGDYPDCTIYYNDGFEYFDRQGDSCIVRIKRIMRDGTVYRYNTNFRISIDKKRGVWTCKAGYRLPKTHEKDFLWDSFGSDWPRWLMDVFDQRVRNNLKKIPSGYMQRYISW